MRTRKRFFFIHLAIFAGLCAAFGVAGVTSYQESRRTEEARAAASPGSPAEAPEARGVLALSSLAGG